MAKSIFICYRRADADITGRIHDCLEQDTLVRQLGVFRDIEDIPLGTRYPDVLKNMLSSCSLMLVIIGKNWLSEKLEDATDFLRIEVEHALQRNIPVIPVLVHGAKLPAKEELPDTLAELSLFQAIELKSGSEFRRDMAHLIKWMLPHLKRSSPVSPGTSPDTQNLFPDEKPMNAGKRTVIFRYGLFVPIGVAILLVLFLMDLSDEHDMPSTPPETTVSRSENKKEPILVRPQRGLDYLKDYLNPEDETQFASKHIWTVIEKDFEKTASQKGAPSQWLAAMHFSKGQIALRNVKFEEASEAFSAAVKSDPTLALGHMGMAFIHSDNDDVENAIAEANEAIRLSPEAYYPILLLARILVVHERYTDSIELYHRVLAMTDHRAFIMGELALVYHAMTDFDKEAADVANEALKKDATVVSARIVLAEQALESGDDETASAHMKTALLQAPNNHAVRLIYAESLAAEGKDKELVLAQYNTALEENSSASLQGIGAERLTIIKESVAKGEVPPLRTNAASGAANRAPQNTTGRKPTPARQSTRRTRSVRHARPAAWKEDRTRSVKQFYL